MSILFATDFLPKSEAAMERAGFLADSLKADLAIVHAVPPVAADGCTLEERVRRADARLVARTSPPNWRWTSQPESTVQFGPAARVVLDNAQRQKASLVVLGPHRGSAFTDAMNGTITEKVLGASTCPLLIAQRDMQGEYRHVLIALDGSANAAAVIGAVESLGLHDNATTVIHAHEPPYAGMMSTVGVGGDATAAYAEASRAQATAGIRELLHVHSNDPGRYRIVVVERRPATAILGAVERLRPDLVVLGTRGHGRFRRALGSVASDVLRAAQCDVLLVPERMARKPATLTFNRTAAPPPQ